MLGRSILGMNNETKQLEQIKKANATFDTSLAQIREYTREKTRQLDAQAETLETTARSKYNMEIEKILNGVDD